jgi:hypothetical protein
VVRQGIWDPKKDMCKHRILDENLKERGWIYLILG